jgi:hypothetical protein
MAGKANPRFEEALTFAVQAHGAANMRVERAIDAFLDWRVLENVWEWTLEALRSVRLQTVSRISRPSLPAPLPFRL